MELQTQRLTFIPCTETSLSIISIAEEYEFGPHINIYLKELIEDEANRFRK